MRVCERHSLDVSARAAMICGSPMKLPLLSLTALVCASLHAPGAIAEKPSRDLKDPIKGDLALKSVGQLAFGANGLLLIAEPGSSALVAVDTGDVGPATKLKETLLDLTG